MLHVAQRPLSEPAPASLRIVVPSKRPHSANVAGPHGEATSSSSSSSSDIEMLPDRPRQSSSSAKRAHNSAKGTSARSDAALSEVQKQLDAESDADDDYQVGQDAQDGRWDKSKGKKAASAAAQKQKNAAAPPPPKKRRVVEDESDDEQDGEEEGDRTEAQKKQAPKPKPKPRPAPRKTNNSAQTHSAAALRVLPYRAPGEQAPAQGQDAPTEKPRPQPAQPSGSREAHHQTKNAKKQARDSAVAFQSPPSASPSRPKRGQQQQSHGSDMSPLSSSSSSSHGTPASARRAASAERSSPKTATRPKSPRNRPTSKRSASKKGKEAVVQESDEDEDDGDDTEPLPEGSSASEAEEQPVPAANKRQKQSHKQAGALSPKRRNSVLETQEVVTERGLVRVDPGENAADDGSGQLVCSRCQTWLLVRHALTEPFSASRAPRRRRLLATTRPIHLRPARRKARCPTPSSRQPKRAKSCKPSLQIVGAFDSCAPVRSKLKLANGPNPPANSLAAIMARTVPTGIRRPGLSRSQRIPSLHKNIKPPPPKKALPPTGKKWDSDDDGEEFLSKKEIERRKRVDDGDESPTEDDVRRHKRMERAKNNGW